MTVRGRNGRTAELVPVATAVTSPALADGHAAGALVWRLRRRRLEVCLIHRPRYRDWSWPKGKLDPGESSATAAMREVAEETGLAVVLGVPLPSLHYRTPDGATKHVRYWAARPAEPSDAAAVAARRPVSPVDPAEIDEVRWVTAAEAHQLLTRQEDRGPLRALEALWEAGRLATRAVVVVRHGRARSRASWKKGEATRPLTDTGHSQARALVTMLAAFGVTQVVTSPWARCVDTVTPYAKAAGVDVEPAPPLTEAAAVESPKGAAKAVRRLLRSGSAVAVATHRPVLPTVFAEITEASRCWMAGAIPTRDPYLRTGETLVVHVTGKGAATRVVAAETHRPRRA